MHRVAPFALIGSALCLAACNPTSGPASGKMGPPARLPTPEAPSLWSIQTVGDAVGKTVLICADAQVRSSFAQSLPEVAGQPCRLTGKPPVEHEHLFATRCHVGADLFTVQAASQGDVDADFTVHTVIETGVGGPPRYEQTLHFRKLAGACPAGWAAGDSGAPGETRLANAVTGAAHSLPQPIRAP